MTSYTSTGSYLSNMDDASASPAGRSRSNSLFENSSTNGASTGRSRSNSLLENPIQSNNSPLPRRTANPMNNSVIQAMITSNNLRNCREVEDMVIQCLNNKDKQSFVCKTAQRYIGGCQK